MWYGRRKHTFQPSTCSKICQKASSWMNWKIRVAVGPICRFLGNMQRMEKAEHHGHRKVRRLVWMPLRQKLSYHAFLLLHVTSTGHMNKASSNMHICTYARGAFSNRPVLRSYIISQIYIYIQMHIQIYVAMIMYIRLNLYVSKKKNHFPMYIAPGCLSTLWTISSMGIPGSLAQLNNWARMPFLMSYGSTCCQSNFTTAFFSCQCSLISSSSSLSIVASLDLEGFDVESTCSLQFSYKILRMQ